MYILYACGFQKQVKDTTQKCVLSFHKVKTQQALLVSVLNGEWTLLDDTSTWTKVEKKVLCPTQDDVEGGYTAGPWPSKAQIPPNQCRV